MINFHARKYVNARVLALALIVFGLALGATAVILFVHDKQSEVRPPAGVTASQAAPSTVKPTAQVVANYTVPPDSPKYLSIPAINITGTRIIRLGLTNSHQIAAPDNVYDTGWYDASAKPGQNGAMFIYGHVSSWTTDGVFYDLKKLAAGDKIKVTRGDNRVFTYQVVTTKIYPHDSVDMHRVLAPINAKTPGLNLMTCTGKVITGTSDFSERLVVFTSLVSS